jgi:hypothetical protein
LVFRVQRGDGFRVFFCRGVRIARGGQQHSDDHQDKIYQCSHAQILYLNLSRKSRLQSAEGNTDGNCGRAEASARGYNGGDVAQREEISEDGMRQAIH